MFCSRMDHKKSWDAVYDVISGVSYIGQHVLNLFASDLSGVGMGSFFVQMW